MMVRTATSEGAAFDAQGSSLRRGACPSLSTPMRTGDGLLVRLRPMRSGFALAELRAIADAAQLCGNGILEITARGNLQIRGLTTETVPRLARRIGDAGIEIAEGLAIETPPLAGFDPSEITDPRPLAAALRAAVQTHQPPLVLAPKLTIVMDGGGRLHLGAVTADIRLRAVLANDRTVWLLSLAGTELTASQHAVVEERFVISAILEILEHLSSMGVAARARDIDPAFWKGRGEAGGQASEPVTVATPAPHPAGIHDLGDNRIALGVGLAFGQIRAEALTVFLEALASLGANDIRLAPGHAMIVLGIAPERILAAQALALGHGLRAFADDPRNHIAACAGMGACASARIDTRAVARLLVDAAPLLLDGSLTVHVSGCAKGCARPSASALTITAAPIGYGLVVNGPALAEPDVTIDENKIRTALERLNVQVGEGKRAGESAGSCLTRLGADAVAAAVQQG